MRAPGAMGVTTVLRAGSFERIFPRPPNGACCFHEKVCLSSGRRGGPHVLTDLLPSALAVPAEVHRCGAAICRAIGAGERERLAAGGRGLGVEYDIARTVAAVEAVYRDLLRKRKPRR